MHVYLIYINSVLHWALWKQSLRQEFLFRWFTEGTISEKGSKESGMDQGKKLSKDVTLYTSFSLIAQGSSGAKIAVLGWSTMKRGGGLLCVLPVGHWLRSSHSWLCVKVLVSRTRRLPEGGSCEPLTATTQPLWGVYQPERESRLGINSVHYRFALAQCRNTCFSP